MKIFERVRPWWRLVRVTRAVFNAFDSIFKPFRAANLREKFRSDEFVIAYMYGVMTRFFDCYGVVGHGTQPAQILLKGYEFVFPGHGAEIVRLTIVRIKGQNERFMRDLRAGSNEADQYLRTKGKSGLPSLTLHLTTQSSFRKVQDGGQVSSP